jgi:hypothetical protein
MNTDTPNPTPDVPAPRRAGPITPGEWSAVLNELRTKGPDAAKVLLARGRTQADGRPARTRTLWDALQREPYKSEWEEALAEFVSKFSDWMHESALKPEIVRRYDRKTGALIEERTSRRDANWAALMVLRRYSPEWRERKAVTVDGQIEHQHQHALTGPDIYTLSGADVLGALTPSEQQALFALLEKVEAFKMEKRNGRELIDAGEPARLEAPRPGIDGE